MRSLRLVCALILGIVVIFMVWYVPRWQVKEAHISLDEAIAVELLTNENEYRRTLVQGLTGLALVASLWMTWKKLGMLEKHALATEELQRTTHESKLTERFYRAVQQLANEHAAVRLGGIYALERMIQDSPRDKKTIQEVLSAYVRMRATEDSDGTVLREDLRASLGVLSRTSPEHVDLAKLNLEGKDLSHLKLSGFWLADAQLLGADLYRASLRGAMLIRADLRNAEMVETDLQRADLSGANLERANLTRAQLNGANIRGANLRGANLRHAVGLTTVQLASCVTDETTNLPLET